MTHYSEMKSRFAESPFRSRFQLSKREIQYLAVHGWDEISIQAETIIRKRLAPATPWHDGKQTPMHGHPVFKAQHGTATCCRGCLMKWHGIPQGRDLSEMEILFCKDMIVDWMKDHAGELPDYPHTPDLWDQLFPEEERKDC